MSFSEGSEAEVSVSDFDAAGHLDALEGLAAPPQLAPQSRYPLSKLALWPLGVSPAEQRAG